MSSLLLPSLVFIKPETCHPVILAKIVIQGFQVIPLISCFVDDSAQSLGIVLGNCVKQDHRTGMEAGSNRGEGVICSLLGRGVPVSVGCRPENGTKSNGKMRSVSMRKVLPHSFRIWFTVSICLWMILPENRPALPEIPLKLSPPAPMPL